MDTKSAELFYMMFILPGLFSLTLVGEGLYKISRKEEGFITFLLGLFFLVGTLFGYLFIFF
jgi:hypothetical protein